jgi:GGDEF domain-containing protein
MLAKAETAESLLPVFATLLQGVAATAIKGDPEQYRQFRAKMQRVVDLDGIRPSASELTMKAETAVNLWQHHCARVNDFFLLQLSELRTVLDLLFDTFADMAVAGPEHTRRLREIAQQIQEAADVAAIKQKKLDLTQCLTEVRQAAQRGLNRESDTSGRDTVTTLDGRTAAEAALVEACSSESPLCAVVLLLDRLPLYNQRYGREVGDKTLRFFAEYLKRSLACAGSLFRWSGPALMMLRSGPADKVQPEIRKALEARIQFDCEAGSRTVLLSVDATWVVLPMMVDPRLLINKIDTFVSG